MGHKVVLITGAAKGIGATIADYFIKDGYKVACGFNHTQPSTKNNDYRYNVHIDIMRRKSVEQAIKRIKDYFRQDINIIINNAAIAQEKPFLNISDQDWATMLDTNLQGAFRVTQELLPSMLQNKWGRVINITSIGGQWGGFNQVHYAASKAALISLTQSIAKIYSKNGITSNAISIGLVATDMSEKELKSEAGQQKLQGIPMERLGSKDEIAKIALFLASDDSSYITGQTINANGGMYFG